MPTIKNSKVIQRKSRTHTVAPTGPDTYTVESGASGNVYNVTAHGNHGTCSCTWASYRPRSDSRSACSHVVSVMSFIAAENGRKVSAWTDKDQASRQHKPTFYIGDNVYLTSRMAQ